MGLSCELAEVSSKLPVTVCHEPPVLDNCVLCVYWILIVYHCGGLPSMQHNDIRDITADVLTEVCPSVSIEPLLQPLTGEQLQYQAAIPDCKHRR